ncbi:M1 family metallopeptidase [uncultured Muriicola sp.]|uniref:M1 family metallopeptidase n=1 Tax=uncultured Muriicola sp. TaxID=1583102 RepID=UPI00261F2D25|nr:M1 family metallopeptidase [uncultured Muriicola sp.]
MRKFVLLGLLLLSISPLFCQLNSKVDFLSGQIELYIQPTNKTIEGKVVYRLQVSEKTNSILIDARNMQFMSVLLNGRKVKFSYDDKQLVLNKKLKTGKEYSLELSYSCSPKQTVYFLGWEDEIMDNEQIWTQGQGKYSSHWVPSFDDMNEKVEFDLNITFDKNYTVVANGKLINTSENGQLKRWYFDMSQPMSSYLLAFAIGNYRSKEIISNSGISITNYFYPKDSSLVEPTFRYTKEIFDFMEREIGISYPWQNYKQLPVRDFLYAGMENTGTTIFSESYMIDSIAFADKNYVNVNAHELTHQWFGNLVTEVDASSHWLHEGFATFYASLAEKELFGDEYFYWLLFDKAQALEALARKGEGESLQDPKASSITFYDKGALGVYVLRERLGEDIFKKGIHTFFNTYQFKNASVTDFMEVMERTSEQDLSDFKMNWLRDTQFRSEEILANLRKNCVPIDRFLRMQRELTTSPENNEAILKRYWDTTSSSEFRKRIIALYYKSLSIDFLKIAFNTKDLKVRQALALIPGPISDPLIESYESLLLDKSYITIENTLYRLWIQSPEHREKYLDKTRSLIGFSNKNIRQLWLLLAILTRDYGSPEERSQYQKELFGYTAAYHPMEVRQLAFGLIGEVFPYTDQNLKDLINAAVHPVWQFKQFARGIIDRLLNDKEQNQRLTLLLDELDSEEYQYLSLKLQQE